MALLALKAKTAVSKSGKPFGVDRHIGQKARQNQIKNCYFLIHHTTGKPAHRFFVSSVCQHEHGARQDRRSVTNDPCA